MQAGRGSPSYTIQQYQDVPSTSYNTYYNSHYPQYSTSNTNTNTSVYNYNYTNSGGVYTMDSQPTSFASASHHSTYSPSSTSNSMHSSKSPCYSSNQYGNSAYLNSHYGSTSYAQTPTQPAVPPKVQQVYDFPELNDMSKEELEKLADDEDRLDDILDKHSQIKDLNTAVEDAIDWVEKTASKLSVFHRLL